MRKNADQEKKEQALAEASINTIEASARKQFEEDKKQMAEARRQQFGEWVRA